jgi:hypothetical protein
MAEGGWVALGAAIGAIGSAATTLLNTWLSERSKGEPDHFDKIAMDVLKSILNEGPEWHYLDYLANVVGLPPEQTRELLLLVGARGHESGNGRWGLVCRVGTKIDSTGKYLD